MTRVALAWMFVAAIVASGLTAAALLVLVPEMLQPHPGAQPNPATAGGAGESAPVSHPQSRPADAASGLQDEVAALRDEVAALRQELAARPVPGANGPANGTSGSAPSDDPGPGLSVEKDALRDALQNLLETENNPAVKDAVRRALAEIRREEKQATESANAEKAKEALLKMIGGRVEELRSELGLSDDQIEQLHTLAGDIVDERSAAQAAGATEQELAAIDRAAQRGVQTIMGAANYREFRKAEMLRAGRPMVGMALAMAGLDAQQWDNVNHYLEGHVDRMADSDVRMQTEDMTPEARQALKDEMDAANKAAWSTILEQYLTPEQRERVPQGR